MLSVDEIQEGLQGERLEVVAAETGLAYNTVRRYAAGIPKRPPVESVQRLSEWVEQKRGRVPSA